MPTTHAILGATGGVGSAIVHSLLSSRSPEDQHINLLVRSKQKLLAQIPRLKTPPSNTTLTIFEGTISDHDLLRSCLQNADCIYQCISAPSPSKPTTISYDTVKSIIAALEAIKSTSPETYTPPTLLLNRSSALNPHLQVPISTPFSHFLHFAIHNIYFDLSRAVDLLHSTPASLLKYILLDAPNLFHPFSPETKTGYEVVTEGAMSLAVNYADFGDAVVEIAGRRGEFRGRGVGVSATGAVVPAWGPNLYLLAVGTWGRLNPFG
ncbi:hypothetical protein M409DRAFT_23704 [Zasmidium cellare ATCC 36951]|uniref:NAD(P)-binding domain-containing protein n=1 Tax=Zasmidium cellare ATCC 36951 TaxID=1080233 RepID=A0A6A6CFG5_ZASCE|nr:uncharacterized protein M409DRAFT_23704 [Zasmidium cellare ATCC 36951]KAF2165977.1 hypothetical protein M409DRAFT_23704 [Zasmidium cellare ATCC 36951]